MNPSTETMTVPGYPINGVYTLGLVLFCVLVVYYVRKAKR